MIKSSIISALFLLVLSSSSFAESKITFSPQCKTKNDKNIKCLELVSTCILNANVKNKDGSVAKNKQITFKIHGLTNTDLSLSPRFLSKKTNSSGIAQLSIRPVSPAKGKKGTILLTSGTSGGSAISNAKLDLQICN